MKRLTRTTTRTLQVFLAAPRDWHYGYEIMKVAAVSSGTLYPLLARLAEDGWLESRWEEPAAPGKPPRQMYRLTTTGQIQAQEALNRAQTSWLRPLPPQEA